MSTCDRVGHTELEQKRYDIVADRVIRLSALNKRLLELKTNLEKIGDKHGGDVGKDIYQVVSEFFS